MEIPDIPPYINTAIPIGRILNEVVINSLKHVFPEGNPGTVRILSRNIEDSFTLEIQSNGVGIPESIDGRNPESPGLMLANSLTTQVRATIRNEPKGGYHNNTKTRLLKIPIYRRYIPYGKRFPEFPEICSKNPALSYQGTR